MYLPTAFAEDRLEVKHGLIRAYPLGMLFIPGAAPTADLVPFALYPGEGAAGLGVLRAHIARANPAWRTLVEGGGECLVVFQGPEAYISPSWYASKAVSHKVVPTWNYAMVQVRGIARTVEDAGWLRRQLGDLTAMQESGLPEPWAVSDAPADFVDGLLKAIVGIEIPIASIVGKWKVSQNRSTADAEGVAAGLKDRAAEMAALVAERIAPGVKPD
ncbi:MULTISPECIES: FMN-binding negative transcriptional regulator [unclassified Duganella]|uniref:FMN-binding negative transcriptional regulator n=1 Tax=unclassified Duganella TaxID=2636909 RepID=UPI0006FCACE4|nr:MULTISPECIES: FMN-binding negative transcriptional regulator [unclassified Duganella]KQV59502.1 transcriptional regulator [Duganella sp. Root336D2]KRB93902.1 transcriptional regulator [Duganella sp. Root198D2]